MDKKSIQQMIKKLMPPGIGFWKDFGGFWEGKWSQVGTKIHKKLVSIAKRHLLKKPCFSLGKTYILKVRGVQVGSKNRSKNEVNMGWHLGIDFSSILVDFRSQVGKQKRAKIDQ